MSRATRLTTLLVGARCTLGGTPTPNSNRWRIAASAAAVMLTIGTIYSWAIFTQPLLVAYQWNLTVTTWAYAAIVLAASVILPYLTKKPVLKSKPPQRARPPILPVPFPRTVPIRHFVKS
jgi:hypothetical protein